MNFKMTVHVIYYTLTFQILESSSSSHSTCKKSTVSPIAAFPTSMNLSGIVSFLGEGEWQKGDVPYLWLNSSTTHLLASKFLKFPSSKQLSGLKTF